MRDRRILLVLGALLAIGGIAWFVHQRSVGQKAGAARDQAQAAGRPVPVIAAQVQKRDVPIYLDGLGSVTAFKTVTVRSQVDGRLDAALFQEGQPVKQGDLLARIDPRPFTNLLHQAQGALARDTAQLKAAQVHLERYKQLVGKKLIAQQQADDQAALVGQLEGAVQVDRAQIDSAKLNLEYASIRSPIDGVSGVRIVDAGHLVRASDAGGLVVITQLDPESGVPQPAAALVAQPVRQGAPLAHHPPGGAGGARHRAAARTGGHLRLRHPGRPDGAAAAAGGGDHPGGHRGHRPRAAGGRAGGGGRPEPAAAGEQGGAAAPRPAGQPGRPQETPGGAPKPAGPKSDGPKADAPKRGPRP
jgi:pyruvate/2-oxoglutarate dehydrogenase complex dihydrolipoamide acyltransferase (E2) component